MADPIMNVIDVPTHNLQEICDTSSLHVWDYGTTSTGDLIWESRPDHFSVYQALYDFYEGTRFRLLFLEGVVESITSTHLTSELGVPVNFFSSHLDNAPPSIPISTRGESNTFYAKWSRCVSQSSDAWTIEQRINDGRPYNVETTKDPELLRLDHERYYRSKKSRPYHPISSVVNGQVLTHAAQEGVSLFWKEKNGIMICVVLSDGPRRYNVVQKKYKFSGAELDVSSDVHNTFPGDISVRVHLISDLVALGKPIERTMIIPNILDLLISQIFGDDLEILSQLHKTLDEINLAMADDTVLRNSLQDWRGNFGFWRKELLDQRNYLKYIKKYKLRMSKAIARRDVGARRGEERESRRDDKRDERRRERRKDRREDREENIPDDTGNENIEISELASEIEATQLRVESIFQSLMSTMSMIESQKAIAQAESVSKLTNLAFFFIPLTFVSGIFGMNIVEFENKLNWWLWVAVSISVTILAYILLFWRELLSSIRRTPQLIKHNSRRFRPRVIRTARTAWFYTKYVGPYILLIIFILGFLAGLGVGLWRLYISRLPKGAKAGISIGIYFVLVTFWWMWTRRFDRKKGGGRPSKLHMIQHGL